MSFKTTFTCNACELVFENLQIQRTHMREPWHVYNLKRRIASLPPISADEYSENVATSLVSNKKPASNTISSIQIARPLSEDEQTDDSNDLDDALEEQAQSTRCLFCSKNSDNLEATLEHMSSKHGLYVPEFEHLSSLETFIGYLRTVISKYNECLYCGMVKQSTEGIRRHMLDKGHCMINLEREPELLEFWEFSESDKSEIHDEDAPKTQSRNADTAISQGEYTLPSGKIVNSKASAREARSLARRIGSANKEAFSQTTTKITIDNTNTTSSTGPTDSLTKTQGRTQDRAVTVRDAVGLIGVPDQQVRSLVTLQRKMQRQQAVVQASVKWAGDKGGIHQRHYKTKMNLRDG